MQSSDQSEDSSQQHRAQRFAVQMPLRYRPAGQTEWQSGSTENISRTGVLFRAQQLIGANTELEMILGVRQITIADTADIVCRGRIVRTMAGATQPPHAIAATIEEFNFVRAADLPPP